MHHSENDRSTMASSGVRFIGAIAVILTLALPVPALVGRRVNALRVGRAAFELEEIASTLRPRSAALRDSFLARPGHEWEGKADKPALLVSTGAAPRTTGASRWAERRSETIANYLSAADARLPSSAATGTLVAPHPSAGAEAGPDPWGNRYLVTLVESDGGVWVLSAGPNGVVESRIDARPFQPRGDDVGVSLESRSHQRP